ncbi:MAG: helix-turn-helix domain-containing protein [Myxococcota bacterium]
MKLIPPSAALRDRVSSFHVTENHGGTRVITPRTGAVLALQLSGRIRYSETLLSNVGVTGIQTAPRTYGYEQNTHTLLVRFTPQGASCLGVPAAELACRSVALDELLPAAQVRELRERLLSTRSLDEQVRQLEQFLIQRPFLRDPLVERALTLLSTCRDEELSVAGVARTLSLSERQLERRFLDRVGLTPKKYASLRRFERAVELAQTAPSLTRVALDAGYYDQSHFIRDFRRFAGTSPSRFLRAAG